jgi:hypothetical protein
MAMNTCILNNENLYFSQYARVGRVERVGSTRPTRAFQYFIKSVNIQINYSTRTTRAFQKIIIFSIYTCRRVIHGLLNRVYTPQFRLKTQSTHPLYKNNLSLLSLKGVYHVRMCKVCRCVETIKQGYEKES